jgi:hypothetical protein
MNQEGRKKEIVWVRARPEPARSGEVRRNFAIYFAFSIAGRADDEAKGLALTAYQRLENDDASGDRLIFANPNCC